ncbi:MAG: RDD family protein [Gleimia sp.]|jgi:uncharacterized RDD family membrane protein YckC
MVRSKNFLADDYIVGEGVALDIPPAGVALRVGSALIDIVVYVVLFLFALYLAVQSGIFRLNDAQQTIFMIVLIATIMLILPVTVETLSEGKSLGRLIFGTRVVRIDQGKAGFREALVRGVAGLIEIWATGGALALLFALLDKRSRRIGDLAAGTMVVKERIPLNTPSPTPMPPYLADWARYADIHRLPTGLSLGVRQFLHRQTTLSVGAREELANELAQDVQKYVYPGPPPNTPAVDFLMAFSAERSRREQARLERNRNLANVLLNEKPATDQGAASAGTVHRS